MSAPRPHIVCVDDEQAVLNQLSAQLRRRFGPACVVECTESAEEALALIDQVFSAGDEVQLVICDQVMPGMKGDRFLELIDQARPDIKKILLTGQAGLESAIYAINHARLDRYIEKPWEAEDLNMAVESLLTQHRLRRELRAEHERLERQSRELRALHEVSLRLGSVGEAGPLLRLVSEEARSLAQAESACAVFRPGPAAPWLWTAEPALDAGLRRRFEEALCPGPCDPAALSRGLPAELWAAPLQRGGSILGFLVVVLPPGRTPRPDTLDLLSLLAHQAAASLDNIRLLEERLQSERLTTIGRMSATIVHDFRNPMTAIKGYAGLFEETDLPASRRREYAGLIIDEIDRMQAMTDEILEFTQGRTIALRPVETSVAELAARVRRLMAPEFADKAVSFETDLRYPGPVKLDAGRMVRALLNVASNALGALRVGGTFTFASRLEAGALLLVLCDDGEGMTEDVRARIFEPFFTHGKDRGIGLGMAIARRIVEEHGGRIDVESRPGSGTRFTLRLPLELSLQPKPPAAPPTAE